ncbi:hypothetical protein [Sodalis-like endosymbiont of Proechinophthirus fluctus]|uniref:hypothetical protein n=1 Tax=Sodalis-like endosymbiont of Proechinophthirus fluctus TaxID=1462730 RepID=UPI0008321952|nr:hypothetical protein [Sodalis-like endosymbiont of Proechinophthirus fluctus]
MKATAPCGVSCKLLIDHWWQQWIGEDWAGKCQSDGDFWQKDKLANRMTGRLERWIGLIYLHGGSQDEMIDALPDELQERFQKRVRLRC